MTTANGYDRTPLARNTTQWGGDPSRPAKLQIALSRCVWSASTPTRLRYCKPSGETGKFAKALKSNATPSVRRYASTRSLHPGGGPRKLAGKHVTNDENTEWIELKRTKYPRLSDREAAKRIKVETGTEWSERAIRDHI